MLYLVVFYHAGDARSAVRVIRGTRVEADCSRDRIAALYDDPAARVVEIADSHDDYDTIVADYDAMLAEG
jgi:hypothetical protein